MLIHFWGVRGSCSVCLTPQQIQKKISAVVQRITAEDIKNVAKQQADQIIKDAESEAKQSLATL